MSKGPDLSRVQDRTLCPECFVMYQNVALYTEQNLFKLRDFNVQALLLDSSKTRLEKIYSIAKTSDLKKLKLEYEIESIIYYEELLSRLNTLKRQQKTLTEAEQCFLLDFE
jgi:hypothetical protein